MEKDEAIFKNDWREDVQLHSNSKDHLTAFLDALENFERMRNRYLGNISVAKHRIDLLNDNIRPLIRPLPGEADRQEVLCRRN